MKDCKFFRFFRGYPFQSKISSMRSIPCIDSAVTLPPLVDGLLRGYVRLSLLEFLPEEAKPGVAPTPVVIQPVWWGESDTKGATQVLLAPRKPQGVRFPVLCSHKYLAR